MRIAILLSFFLVPVFAFADAAFDSVFRKADILVKAWIVSNGKVSSDSGDHQYFCFIDLYRVARGGHACDSSLIPSPEDTLSALYYTSCGTSCMKEDNFYLIALVHNPLTKRFEMVESDFCSGHHKEILLFDEYCPVSRGMGPYEVHTFITSRSGSKRMTTERDSAGSKVSFASTNYMRHRKLRIEKYRTYDMDGKTISQSRTRYKYFGNGTVVTDWTFHNNGKFCIKRSKGGAFWME